MIKQVLILASVIAPVSAFGGMDLNAYGGYESGRRTFSSSIANSTDVTMIGTPIGINFAAFVKNFPLSLGIQVQSNSPKAKVDDVDYKLTSTKVSGLAKVWFPGMKSRVKPFGAARYQLYNQETYSQQYGAGTSGFGTIKTTYSGTSVGYGIDAGVHISLNKFYLFSELAYSMDTNSFAQLKTETDAGSSTTDIVDKSKLTSKVYAIELGFGMTWGAGK